MKRLIGFGLLGFASAAWAQAVLPGYLTDPSMMKGALGKDESYQTPEAFKYPYVSTYYVKPTVTPDEEVRIGIFMTDFESSKIRFLDDSHRFTAFLEYGIKGGDKKVLSLTDLKSGDAEFVLGKLPVGEYELRTWVVDVQGRESHRVLHDFRVKTSEELAVPADRVYVMTAEDLAAYGIRNDGDTERVVYVGTNGTRQVVKEKRADVPGYTVTVQMDSKTGKLPFKAYSKARIAWDSGYRWDDVEAASLANVEGLQKMLDEKAAAGFRKLVMLPGTYRLSFQKSIFLPDNFTLDLNQAVLKQNGFKGAHSIMVRLASARDAHLVNGTLEGDYWTHNYKDSPDNSEWPAAFEIGGDSWYCSVEGVKVSEITGYGGQNGIARDARGDLAFFYESLPKFAAGGLDAKTGAVDGADRYRFTTDFKDVRKILDKGSRRLQVSRYLGYQCVATRSWQVIAAWYDADKNFLSAETCWQYREILIPAKAAFLRVCVEAESAEAADEAALKLTAFRLPVNCTVKNCRFELCRCVGYAASAMKNMLFEGNFFTTSGESAARCAFDAEDGWDQMQDVYFLKNVFRDNPVNNSILACAGHNFILEKNDGDVFFWGRVHSACVRDNDIVEATYCCDNRLRSGYGRFEGNRYSKSVNLGRCDGTRRTDTWDHVLSGESYDGEKDSVAITVGNAGRMVNCTFKNMPALIANAYACTFENCTGGDKSSVYPSGRWFEVTVKDSRFWRFFGSNNWERCHFTNTKFESFFRGNLQAKGCDFKDCDIFAVGLSSFQLTDCLLEGTSFRNNWWEAPANFAFKGCMVKTRDNDALLKLAVYAIGKVSFEDGTIAGKKGLVDVHDQRALKTNIEPNPDTLPGEISLKGVKWESEAKAVVLCTGSRRADASSKAIFIHDQGNVWPEGVSTSGNAPETWILK